MTLRRDELNPLDALRAVASRYPGGVEALALRIPRRASEHGEPLSASLLYKKLEGVRPIYFDEFVQIIAMCAASNVADAYAPLRALAWRHGHVAVRLPDLDGKSSGELAQMVVRVFKEGGDVARVVEKALADDQEIGTAEGKEIDREIEQAIAALAELRERVRAVVKQPTQLRAVKP
jgi:hypothetical protein